MTARHVVTLHDDVTTTVSGSDDGCTPYGSTATGGLGGGIIHIFGGTRVEVDGSVVTNGDDGSAARAGGGSGGSILIRTIDFRGLGSITADGGSVVGTSTCQGGGGAGGRIAIMHTTNSYTGTRARHVNFNWPCD